MKTKAEFKNRSWIQFKNLLTLQAIVLLAAAPIQTRSAPGDLDLSFDPGSSVNGGVFAIAVQKDGKVLIGGFFTTVHGAMRTGLARLNAAGSVDDSFVVTLAAARPTDTANVSSIGLQNDGKILIAGGFISVNGVARTNLARLNTDGTLDESFLNVLEGFNNSPMAISVQPDAKILIAGYFSSVTGVARTNLARLNADGTLDGSFLNGLTGPNGARCVSLQSDGKILIGGSFTSVNGVARTNLARLNADGTLDGSFLNGLAGPIGSAGGWLGDVQALAIQPDGKILLGGRFTLVNGVERTNIVRLHADGSIDDSFLTTWGAQMGDYGTTAFALQSDGKIIVAKSYGQVHGLEQLARLNTDGSLDNSFLVMLPELPRVGGGGVFSVALQPGGKILVAGGVGVIVNGGNYLCRLRDDGSRDDTFEHGPAGPLSDVSTLAAQPDGRVLIGGVFAAVNGVPCGRLARLMADGSLDNTFLNGLAGADGDVNRLMVQADGRIVIGGRFSSVNGVARQGVVRLNADGSLDDSFTNYAAGWYGTIPSVSALEQQGDGKIVIGGSFISVNGVGTINVARLNADGSLDGSFTSGLGGGYNEVRALAVQADGKILISSVWSPYLARLNANGTRDTSFLNGLAGPSGVAAISLQSDGKILIAGPFSSVNGGVARLNANGTFDASFHNSLTEAYNFNWCILPQADGRILVGGEFKIPGTTRKGIARLQTDGSVDDTFLATKSGLYGAVDCMVVQGNGMILLGGSFTAVNQVPRSFLARLKGDYFPPTMRTVLQNQTAELASGLVWKADVGGGLPLTYLWFFNGTNLLACSTNCALQLTNVQFSGSGTYTLIVTNLSGAVTSSPAMLNVIPRVERRPVPGVKVTGEAGSWLNVDYVNFLSPAPNWTALGSVSLTSTSQFYFDLSAPLPPQRFYRAWQTGTPSVVPSLNLNFVPAITLTGNVGDSLRLDYINAIGPTDAWVTLDTVTLTNTPQLYFDVSAPGQPARLYRIIPVP